LAYLIWQTAIQKLQKSSETNETAKPSSEVFDESDTEARAVKSKFKLAKKHLAKAIALDPHSFIYIQYAVSVSCLEFDLRMSNLTNNKLSDVNPPNQARTMPNTCATILYPKSNAAKRPQVRPSTSFPPPQTNKGDQPRKRCCEVLPTF